MARTRRRPAAPPAPRPDPLEQEQRRVFAERQDRDEAAKARVAQFRADMEAAPVALKRWAAERARAEQAEWHGYETATHLIEAEIAREAITVARGRLRAGATLGQALAHATALVEEQFPEIVERLGLQQEAWATFVPGGLTAETVRDSNRRKRITSLRAKARSTPFPEEAAAFGAKADELARNYGLNL
jgi:hypothetical protein